jgi:hypothetical protein
MADLAPRSQGLCAEALSVRKWVKTAGLVKPIQALGFLAFRAFLLKV